MADTPEQAALRAAFNIKLSVIAQTLSDDQQTQALTNLGVIDALEELITEYGGTVPTSLSETNAVSTQSTDTGTDPWAELS